MFSTSPHRCHSYLIYAQECRCGWGATLCVCPVLYDGTGGHKMPSWGIVYPIIWSFHLNSLLYVYILGSFYCGRFHCRFPKAFNVSSPSPYSFPHTVPILSLFNHPILASSLSLFNTTFYFSFLGRYPPPHTHTLSITSHLTSVVICIETHIYSLKANILT